MSTRTVSVSLPVPTRGGLLKNILAALVGAAIAVAVVLSVTGGSGGSAPTREAFRGNGFALAAPKGWTSASTEKLADRPALMLERPGRGVVIVKTGPAPKDQSLTKLTSGLTGQLRKRFPDFRFVSARVQQLRGGPAFLFTFVRTKQGTAQSVALIKLGGVSYTLDTVTKSGDTAAASEAAGIVRSFGP
jgi:hypothetical protein